MFHGTLKLIEDEIKIMPFSEIRTRGLNKISGFQVPLVFIQKSGRGKGQGDVMPTLDMALFDWTDYEDMKPVDAWPSSRKKG